MTLQVPKDLCNIGHHVQVGILNKEVTGVDPCIVLEGTGKVVHMESVDDHYSFVKVKLIQIEESDWDNLCGIYN